MRRRRSYSASLLDLDGDRDLDLVNVSDFAGLDVFENDGRGHFRDAGQILGAARHAFGMAHAFQDANGDARPDLLMLGMDSPVAERLEGLGLRRLAPGEPPGMVRAMTRGNRLYFGTADRAAPLVPASDAVDRPLASTGWTWGAGWEDFDLDGRLDLAVANGHETRSSVADYERQFWRHDRFVAGSDPDPAAKLYFQTAAGRRQAAGASYGGWQDNQFLLQFGDGEFAEVAWLLGLAVPMDCRNLVAADLDLDGRPDLVLTTQEGWPRTRQRLLVYRNRLTPRGRWMGFRFAGAPPSGTQVMLEMPGGTRSRWRTTGDGFRSQGPAAVHFGLGDAAPVRARIQWGTGKPDTVIESPAADRWHAVPVP
ncbi:MAG: CRTAC1 family protein [Verrucomicrobia bacterium]|nr:CRTAC1 family protein [Verrucomicrobiota bacterium]